MSRRQLSLVMLMGLLVVVTAVAVVHSKYASRKYFVELQTLRDERDRLDVEWGRLQLEQSTWATHGRVARIANAKLKMRIPSADEVVVIRP